MISVLVEYRFEGSDRWHDTAQRYLVSLGRDGGPWKELDLERIADGSCPAVAVDEIGDSIMN